MPHTNSNTPALVFCISSALVCSGMLLTGCDQKSTTTTSKTTQTSPGGTTTTTTTTDTNRKVDVDTNRGGVKVETDNPAGPRVNVETKRRTIDVDVDKGKVDVDVK